MKINAILSLLIIATLLFVGCAPKHKDYCEFCDGVRKCPKCHGAGHTMDIIPKPCKTCEESGECPKCHGTGLKKYYKKARF